MATMLHIGRIDRQVTCSKWHQHDHWEIVAYFEGEGVVRAGEHVSAFSPGTIVCLPPHVPHSEDAPAGFRNYYILCDDLPPLEQPLPVFQDEAGQPFLQLAGLVFSEFYRFGPERSRRLVNRYFELMMDYLQRYQGQPGQDEPEDDVSRRLEELILEHLHDPEFNLEQSMQALGLSASQLRRVFRRTRGKSPMQYLVDLRIEHAGQMLQAGYSVKQSAFASGFADPYYFSRCFRKRTGMPPSRYAQKVRLPQPTPEGEVVF